MQSFTFSMPYIMRIGRVITELGNTFAPIQKAGLRRKVLRNRFGDGNANSVSVNNFFPRFPRLVDNQSGLKW
jgi:hypothetical protein